MKIVAFIALFATSAVAFAPTAFTRSKASSVVTFAEPEEGSLDLDLEEMFDMFDAADKEEDFDEAIKKVKADE